MLQFLVVSHGTDWVVKRKTQSASRFTDRLKAITAWPIANRYFGSGPGDPPGIPGGGITGVEFG